MSANSSDPRRCWLCNQPELRVHTVTETIRRLGKRHTVEKPGVFRSPLALAPWLNGARVIVDLKTAVWECAECTRQLELDPDDWYREASIAEQRAYVAFKLRRATRANAPTAALTGG